jgi:hypothetical protein
VTVYMSFFTSDYATAQTETSATPSKSSYDDTSVFCPFRAGTRPYGRLALPWTYTDVPLFANLTSTCTSLPDYRLDDRRISRCRTIHPSLLQQLKPTALPATGLGALVLPRGARWKPPSPPWDLLFAPDFMFTFGILTYCFAWRIPESLGAAKIFLLMAWTAVGCQFYFLLCYLPACLTAC